MTDLELEEKNDNCLNQSCSKAQKKVKSSERGGSVSDGTSEDSYP